MFNVPFNPQNYRDNVPPRNLTLYSAPPPAVPFVGMSFAATFNNLGYIDRTSVGVGDNNILPNIVQTQISTFLNFIENVAPFNPKSYRDSVNYDGGANAFLPGIIQYAIKSPLLGVPFNGLGYRDSSLGPLNPNLYALPSVTNPFVNLWLLR